MRRPAPGGRAARAGPPPPPPSRRHDRPPRRQARAPAPPAAGARSCTPARRACARPDGTRAARPRRRGPRAAPCGRRSARPRRRRRRGRRGPGAPRARARLETARPRLHRAEPGRHDLALEALGVAPDERDVGRARAARRATRASRGERRDLDDAGPARRGPKPWREPGESTSHLPRSALPDHAQEPRRAAPRRGGTGCGAACRSGPTLRSRRSKLSGMGSMASTAPVARASGIARGRRGSRHVAMVERRSASGTCCASQPSDAVALAPPGAAVHEERAGDAVVRGEDVHRMPSGRR